MTHWAASRLRVAAGILCSGVNSRPAVTAVERAPPPCADRIIISHRYISVYLFFVFNWFRSRSRFSVWAAKRRFIDTCASHGVDQTAAPSPYVCNDIICVPARYRRPRKRRVSYDRHVAETAAVLRIRPNPTRRDPQINFSLQKFFEFLPNENAARLTKALCAFVRFHGLYR